MIFFQKKYSVRKRGGKASLAMGLARKRKRVQSRVTEREGKIEREHCLLPFEPYPYQDQNQ